MYPDTETTPQVGAEKGAEEIDERIKLVDAFLFSDLLHDGLNIQMAKLTFQRKNY